MQRAEQPIFLRCMRGLEDFQKGRSQAKDGLPSVGWIGLTLHHSHRLQAGNCYPHGLMTDTFGLRQHRYRCRAIPLQAEDHRFLRLGEISCLYLLAQSALQSANGNAEFPRQN